MSLTISSLFKDANKPWIRRKLNEMWKCSIKVAALSEVLARGRRGLDPSEAMLAGLLHDVGVVPIVLLCDKKFGQPKDPQAIDEAMYLLSPHLTSWILQQWRLGDNIAKVPDHVRNLQRTHDHHADYTDIIQVALLHTWRGKDHPLGRIPWHQVPAFEKLELTPEESIEAIKESHKEIKEVMAMLKG